jgi:hypothetical protein
VLFGQNADGTGSVNISLLKMDGDSSRRPVETLLSGGLNENGEISPDGR